jgi:hypothetical protein
MWAGIFSTATAIANFVIKIILVLMSGVYWVIAWFASNDLYNGKFAAMDDSMRGLVSNVLGWAVACVIGNVSLLAINNFIEVVFKEDS